MPNLKRLSSLSGSVARLDGARAVVLILALALGAVGGQAGEKRDPRLARSLYDMVKPLLAEGKSEEALPYLEKALQHDPEFHAAAMAAAGIYESQGKKEKAAELYERVKKSLAARPKRSAEEEQLLAEATKRLFAAKGEAGALGKLVFEHVEALRQQAAALEAKGEIYHALRITLALLAIEPEDELAIKTRRRLEGKVGWTLAATARGALDWQPLFNGKDLDGWYVYGGEWKVTSGLLRQGREADLVLLYNGPPRRNFIFRARVRLSWGGRAYLLGRAQRDGTFYSGGLYLSRDVNAQTKEVIKENPTVCGYRHERWRTAHTLEWQSPPKEFVLKDAQWYTLELRCEGDKITFRVDGKVIFTKQDDKLKEGTVGLSVRGGDDHRFADLRRIEILDLP